MAGNRKPRKAYRPKVANTAAHAQAMNAVTLLTAEEREKCAGAPERALQAFVDGVDPAHNWSVMADALNVAEALSDVGICSDLASRDTIRQGQVVLADIHAMQFGRGDGEETLAQTLRRAFMSHERQVATLARAIEMHRIQLSLCDYSEYRRAIEAVKRKTAGALAGSAGPGVTVVGALENKHDKLA